MKLLLCVIALATLNGCLGLKTEFAEHLFNQFKKNHDKQYLGAEHNHRFSIFQKNLETIEKHNSEYSMGMHTYRLGINHFADLTVQEFKNFYLGTRLSLRQNTTKSLTTFQTLPSWMQVPRDIDWRKHDIVTPVKNQAQCGSCWAFSTTGSLEGAHARASGHLVSLSEQQLVDCSSRYGNNGCNGGLMDNAFEYVLKNGGVDSEESYPYHGHEEKCHFKVKNIGSTCSGFVDIARGDEIALKHALATAGPVSIAIDVTEDKFMLYRDGVFVDETCSNDPSQLNHGVLIVGYGTATENGQEKDYWIVKNSWSTKWGEEGYIRMARNMDNMCGVATSASYPLVKDDKIVQ